MRRLEQKFSCLPDLDLQRLVAIGDLEPVLVRQELDTYFFTRQGSLFLRRLDDEAELVQVRRLNTPLPRESHSHSTPVTDPDLEDLLASALGVQARVKKKRAQYRGRRQGVPVRVHLDQVEGLGTFVELAVEVKSPFESDSAAVAVLAETVESLGLAGADALPYSYSDLAAMTAAARRHRKDLAEAGGAGKVGRMIILDGASCSGKTTLGTWLLEEASVALQLVPRYTTRAPRAEEKEGSEYLFTSPEELHRLTQTGELFEYRDFEFGMSYGLPWKAALEVLTTGHNGLGIMNLGNVRHMKRVFPEAVTVLIHAPIQEIERRLHERGMPESHIAERLGNARRVESYREHYDHVVENEDGCLAAAQEELLRIVGS